jgi:hypothetical protein
MDCPHDKAVSQLDHLSRFPVRSALTAGTYGISPEMSS